MLRSYLLFVSKWRPRSGYPTTSSPPVSVEGECALIDIHSHLLTGYMRFDATFDYDSFAVRVAMGPFSSSLASLFTVPSPSFDDARDVASLHPRRIPTSVLCRGRGGGTDSRDF